MRILTTNPTTVPPHRLNETDFGMSRIEILQMLRRSRYDVLILTDLPEAPAIKVHEWVKTAGWKIPTIVIGINLPKGLDALAVLSPKEATAEALEAQIRLAPCGNDDSSEWPAGNVQQLINLTKEAVAAMTLTASESSNVRKEIGDLRTSLREDVRNLGLKVDEIRIYADKQRDLIVAKMNEGPLVRIHDSLKWLTEHPFLAFSIFIATLILMGSLVVGINALQPNKMEMIKDWSGHGTKETSNPPPHSK